MKFKYTVGEEFEETMIWTIEGEWIATVDDDWVYIFKDLEKDMTKEFLIGNDVPKTTKQTENFQKLVDLKKAVAAADVPAFKFFTEEYLSKWDGYEDFSSGDKDDSFYLLDNTYPDSDGMCYDKCDYVHYAEMLAEVVAYFDKPEKVVDPRYVGTPAMIESTKNFVKNILTPIDYYKALPSRKDVEENLYQEDIDARLLAVLEDYLIWYTTHLPKYASIGYSIDRVVGSVDIQIQYSVLNDKGEADIKGVATFNAYDFNPKDAFLRINSAFKGVLKGLEES